MDEKRGFASKIGFMLSMAAFCIGIGNLWKFPYVVGANGGGAFLLVYIIMTVIIGIPCFMIEVTLGRSSQLSPIAGMIKLEGGKKNGWALIGVLEVIAIFCICVFSGTVIGGWSLGYVWKVISGQLSTLGPDEIAAEFGFFSGSLQCIGFAVANTVLLWLCLNSGVKKGVEKVCSILLPTLFVIMIGLAIYSNLLDGAWEGLKWYLTPDFSKIDINVIGAATTQVFFSIGIGMCVAYVYGSYIDKSASLPGSLTATAVMDTGIAFLAGMICTPALFAFDMEPTAGPPLIFITLPQLFNAMGGFGRVFGALFMLCVYAAGFSSMLGGCEALVASLTDSTKLTRKKSCVLLLGALFVLSIPVTLSFSGDNALSAVKIFGFGIFDFLDFLSSGFCMPICAILMYVYAIWKWGFGKFQKEVNTGSENAKFRIPNALAGYFKYVMPIILIFGVYSVLHTYGVI